jgi:voltage-gated potassium channel Kch
MDMGLLNLIEILIMIHLLRIFTCILGYFSLSQKSGRIITYFMMLSTVSVLARGIVSLMILLHYSTVELMIN